MSPDAIPTYQAYMNPILAALRSLGGSATIEVLDARVVRDMALPEAVLQVPHKPDRPERSEVSYRMAWARTYLRFAGLIANPAKGTWALTEQGALTAHVDEYALAAQYAARAKAKSDEPEEAHSVSSDADAPLDPALRAELRSRFDTLLAQGQVLRREQLDAAYRRFRERFGPEVLAALDGERLLATMHGRSTKDSLVYWLEFKDDEEFPRGFGSIAGGSALKFGFYQARDGGWWTGSPQKQTPLSLDEAIERARAQRAQLLEGARILAGFSGTSADDYAERQRQLTAAAPDVAETSWGHKYFSLLAPERLDDYHAPAYQRYHLIKLLQRPAEGRYANAAHFVRFARELSITPNQLAAVLNHRDGSPHEYWRIGTSLQGESETEWPRMRDGGFIAIGWTELGDLSGTTASREAKDALRLRMGELFAAPSNVTSRKTQEVFNFTVNVHERDVVLAMEGRTVKGVGVVRGPYYFEQGDGPFGHRHRVEWLDTSEWLLPEPEGLRTTFVPLSRHVENLLSVERRLFTPKKPIPPVRAPTVRPLPPLSGMVGRVQSALDRKSQVILYGPPGTGKTYWAEKAVWELVARAWYGKEASQLTDDERKAALEQRALSSCTFHPAYGYEDFIEGYRPFAADTGMGFRLEPGIFSEVCRHARQDKRSRFLLIDEINRGDIPRIFGELLTLLEKDKRNREFILPVSRQPFSVPDNVRVVGTMNTADRSIALLDAALRRRFAFVELMPDYEALGSASVAGLPLGPWLNALNERIVKHVGRDARNLQIGHAYLMQAGHAVTDPSRFHEIFRDDIVPLLEEYCYGEPEALAEILGAPLVTRDGAGGTPRPTSFEDGNALAAALLQSFEDLAITATAIAADVDETVDDEVDADEAEDSGIGPLAAAS